MQWVFKDSLRGETFPKMLLILLSAVKRVREGNSRGPIRCQHTMGAVAMVVEEEEEVTTTQLFPSV